MKSFLIGVTILMATSSFALAGPTPREQEPSQVQPLADWSSDAEGLARSAFRYWTRKTPNQAYLTGAPRLYTGVPDGLPVQLPFPEGTRILGTLLLPGHSAEILAEVPLPPDTVREFYRTALLASNWEADVADPPLPDLPPGQLMVAQSAFGAGTVFFHGSAGRGPSLEVDVQPLPDGSGSDVGLTLVFLDTQRESRRAFYENLLGERRETIPPLRLPKGSVFLGGGSSSGHNDSLDLEFRSELSARELEADFRQQFLGHGWTLLTTDGRGIGAWSTCDFVDSHGERWQARLTVFEGRGTARSAGVVAERVLEEGAR